jgi:hypothetical protein
MGATIISFFILIRLIFAIYLYEISISSNNSYLFQEKINFLNKMSLNLQSNSFLIVESDISLKNIKE